MYLLDSKMNPSKNFRLVAFYDQSNCCLHLGVCMCMYVCMYA